MAGAGRPTSLLISHLICYAATRKHAYSSTCSLATALPRSCLLRKEDRLPFSIVQVIPGTVIGPSELVTLAIQAYKQMNCMSKALLFAEAKLRYAFGFVHVKDCAAVYVKALDEVKLPSDKILDWFIAPVTTEAGKDRPAIW
ncbi:hypothetical protein K505DRAFT_399803 [Melanomma pulvis-pyrius CBS 109.77]|uniref:Uncharacterized protein n=1 Tax=Melanomma pulvis-pyrius CBS 109.77 TaxID=1314802 RepID=A0A6A6WQE8_9PLEO|nr:hypothetical protein K505DRAFT_399803 [Melanomma pulvis-pyrius CBS 109.77]